MENYNFADLPKEQLVLFVASTFGNGHPPENGKVLQKVCCSVKFYKGFLIDWKGLNKLRRNKIKRLLFQQPDRVYHCIILQIYTQFF